MTGDVDLKRLIGLIVRGGLEKWVEEEDCFLYNESTEEDIMEIEKICGRHYSIKYILPKWDLNLHFITGNQYNYIIDTGLGSESVAPILDFLRDTKRQTVVINTHHHWDHIWGNHCFKDGAILAHRLCRQLIVKRWDDMLERHPQYPRGSVAYCLPNLVFDEGVYFPDDGIRVFYTPGHTVDSVSVYDETDRVLDVGDNIGDTAEELIPVIGTELDVYAATIREYRALDVEVCLSGHNSIQRADVFERIQKEIGV